LYLALYRKWRPNDFENIIGQDHIVRALRNQVKSGTVAHAYLFSGPRGTGKTSTAKIFARAVNCLNPSDGNPCGVCRSCEALAEENNLDIIEIDAASNNSVDEIRDLRENVKYPPIMSKYKVYIVDEIHMLSSGAFNAFLKTLEEPPQHAIFILATTEQHKLPATIVSRCQRYDFRQISTEAIANRLKKVLADADASITDDAVLLIARSAEGGMRDALSIADMCLAYCGGGTIGYDDVARVIGSADKSTLYAFVDALIDKNSASALEIINRLSTAGADISILVRDIIDHLRNLVVYMSVKAPDAVIDEGKEAIARYGVQAGRAAAGDVLAMLEMLAETEYRMKWSQRPKTFLEAAVMRICNPGRAANIEELAARLEVLEKRIAQKEVEFSLVDVVEQEIIPPPVFNQAPKTIDEPKAEPTQVRHAETKTDSHALWNQIKSKIKKKNTLLYMLLQDVADAVIKNGKLEVRFPKQLKTNLELANTPERLSVISEAAKEAGIEYPVVLTLMEDLKPDAQEQIRIANELFGEGNFIIKDGGN